jgi:uncharacterized protein (TIGR02246 family)
MGTAATVLASSPASCACPKPLDLGHDNPANDMPTRRGRITRATVVELARMAWGYARGLVFQKGLVVFTAAVAFAASSGAAQAPSPGTRKDEDAINAVIAATTDAFTRHDAKAWVRFCTLDAQLVTVRGESMRGVAEIEKGLTKIFETRGRKVTLKTLNVAVRFIRPDVALAHVTNELSGLLSPEGQTRPSHQELSIRVLVKNQGAWLITAFHNTILQK